MHRKNGKHTTYTEANGEENRSRKKRDIWLLLSNCSSFGTPKNENQQHFRTMVTEGGEINVYVKHRIAGREKDICNKDKPQPRRKEHMIVRDRWFGGVCRILYAARRFGDDGGSPRNPNVGMRWRHSGRDL